MNAEDAGKERRDTGSGTEKQLPDSEATGTGGPIPGNGDGVGIGAGAEPNTFEPEEDPDAAKDN
jgi:hypothetical protein